jgi:hypothetical protein
MESEVICELNDLVILNYSSSIVEFRSEKFPADSSFNIKGRNLEKCCQTHSDSKCTPANSK